MQARSTPRPDLEAHSYVMRLPFPVVAKELSQLLGRRLTAYIADVSDTRAVTDWEAGAREPRPHLPQRLQLALVVAKLIAGHDDARVAQAWFQGLNPELDDRSPARLLREGDIDEAGPLVLAAARAFVIGG
jgi:hypothetical protein